jgi:hypothetical protein
LGVYTDLNLVIFQGRKSPAGFSVWGLGFGVRTDLN